MHYRYLKNLSDSKIHAASDLSELNIQKTKFNSKSDFRAWSANPNTDHVFYSLNEGDLSSVRLSVSGENKVCAVWGVVADYDHLDIDWSIIDKLLDAQCKELKPTWRTKTQSGWLRLVWEFEGRLLTDPTMYDPFMKAMAKKLKLERLFQGFDKQSLKFSQYFELGEDWVRVGERIPESIYKNILLKVGIDSPPQAKGNISIPIEVIAEKVHNDPKFSGRWGEDFSIGTRGPLFWIDDGIEREGCQVAEDGMICYSDRAGKGFLTWKEIFGPKFVEEYETKKLSALTDEYWYTGIKYFKLIHGIPSQIQEKQVILELRRAGFSPRIKRGQTLSEIEAALLTIQNDSRIDEVAPVIFSEDRVVYFNSHKILNNANISPVEPAGDGDPSLWPFLDKWISQFFISEESRMYFYAWLQRFYNAVLYKKDDQGQALLLVGATNKGKSLLSNRVIAALVGGFADASDYLSGQTAFNKDLARVAAWVIDDTTSAASFQDQRRATELIKKSVANPRIEYHAKYADSVSLPWCGRVIMSLNMDPNSLSVIPALDSSNRDKLMSLRVSNTASSKFPPNNELESIIRQELPHFAKWLLDHFKIPEEMKGPERFGVKTFIDKEIEMAAYDNSSRSSIAELVEFFAKKGREYGIKSPWYGTLTDFQAQLHDLNGGRILGMSANLEFMRRGVLILEESCKANKKLRPISSAGYGGGKIWTIDLDEKWDICNEKVGND